MDTRCSGRTTSGLIAEVSPAWRRRSSSTVRRTRPCGPAVPSSDTVLFVVNTVTALNLNNLGVRPCRSPGPQDGSSSTILAPIRETLVVRHHERATSSSPLVHTPRKGALATRTTANATHSTWTVGQSAAELSTAAKKPHMNIHVPNVTVVANLVAPTTLETAHPLSWKSRAEAGPSPIGSPTTDRRTNDHGYGHPFGTHWPTEMLCCIITGAISPAAGQLTCW